MSARSAILDAIRANKPELCAQAPAVSGYDDSYPTHRDELVALFAERLATMGGAWHEPAQGQSVDAAMRAALAEKLDEKSVVASNVPEVTGNRAVAGTAADLHDVDIAVLRARFAVAETGSVAFTENELIVNAIAYLAQHLIVLLDPAEVVTNMHRAYQRDDYNNARYTVFHTGPSATADIEGVLVRGAQGVRSLTVISTP